jgi:hypothetical protein
MLPHLKVYSNYYLNNSRSKHNRSHKAREALNISLQNADQFWPGINGKTARATRMPAGIDAYFVRPLSSLGMRMMLVAYLVDRRNDLCVAC